MGKPLIYFQFDELTQCEPGWFSYEEDGLGPVRKTVDEVVGCIGFLLKRDCQVEDAYAKRIDSLFAYRDRSNCKCILDATLPEGLRWRTFRLWGSGAWFWRLKEDKCCRLMLKNVPLFLFR